MSDNPLDLKGAALDTAKKAADGFLAQLLGVPAAEAGALVGDYVRSYRWKCQLAIVEKARAHLIGKGISPRQVPMKVLAPLIEQCSCESEPSMHERWAALLANAANPDFKLTVRPDFATALAQLTPKEAEALDYLYTMTTLSEKDMPSGLTDQEIAEKTGMPDIEARLAVDNFVRLGFVQRATGSFLNVITKTRTISGGDAYVYSMILTNYGEAFVTCCRFQS